MKLTFVAFVSCLLLGFLAGSIALQCDQTAFDNAVDTCRPTSTPATPLETANEWTDAQREELCRAIATFRECMVSKNLGKECQAAIADMVQEAVQYATPNKAAKPCNVVGPSVNAEQPKSNTAARTTHPPWLLAALLFVVSTTKVAAFQ
ncbi:uncharacterized protein LOC135365859 [Ornithodoros turicata]|uniref:uncharacterized protein LOC135365859 n=1 Tax=Ornithodoros turicata TaxID=34597 RepID=UPI003139FE4E